MKNVTRFILVGWLVGFGLLSGVANAVTTTQLIQKYGKSKVIKLIGEKTNDGVTILIHGQLKKAHSPSLDYVNTKTIDIDLNRLRLTPNQVDKTLADNHKEAAKYDNSKIVKDESYWQKKQDRWNALEAESKKLKNRQKAMYKTKGGGNDISARCAQKWETNYRMVKYCIGKQQQALRSLQGSKQVPDEISSQCTQKWGTNYRMVKYCIGKQQNALQELRNSGIYK